GATVVGAGAGTPAPCACGSCTATARTRARLTRNAYCPRLFRIGPPHFRPRPSLFGRFGGARGEPARSAHIETDHEKVAVDRLARDEGWSRQKSGAAGA